MCGGRGARLGNLSQSTPKPLVKLNNKTILEIKIERYLQQGFNEFIFCIGYKGKSIRELLARTYPNIPFEFSDAGEDAGILQRLYNAKNLFENHVLMSYGDTFTDIEITRLSEFHKNSDNEATIVVAPIQNPFGLVEFDKNNKVTLFNEKPVLNYYIGYAIINKSAINMVPNKIIHMQDGVGLTTFFKILAAMGKLGAYYHNGVKITFNTQEDIKLAEEQLVQFYTLSENENGI